MAYDGKPAVPGWYWIVAVAALLWSLMGCFAYYMQMTTIADEAKLAALPEAQRAIWLATPSWVFAAYAIAVFAGLAGAVALLLRRRFARTAFALSLIAVIVQFGYTFLGTDILSTMSLGEAAGLPAFIIIAAIAQLWFAHYATQRGWLR